jgi:hypothetical protein
MTLSLPYEAERANACENVLTYTVWIRFYVKSINETLKFLA